MPELPVFYPTLAEFCDFRRFVEYAESLPEVGEYGAFKVVAPQGWSSITPHRLPEARELPSVTTVEQFVSLAGQGEHGVYEVNLVQKKPRSFADFVALSEADDHKPPSDYSAMQRELMAKAPERWPAVVARDPIGTGLSDADTSDAGGAGASVGPADPVRRSTRARDGIVPRDTAAALASDKVADSLATIVRERGVSALQSEGPLTSARPLNVAHQSDNLDPSELTWREEAERAFWRSMSTIKAPPQYGADNSGTIFESDEACGWNLNNLDSVLSELGSSVPGVTKSMLYFGMWRAHFCWHKEDVDLASINYLHFGAPKCWYIVPPQGARRLEACMESFFPILRKSCAQFMRHKTVMMSPKILHARNIPFTRVWQRPGEFVVVLPKSYHAGFNTGLNCAEAVNFATPRWFPIGRAAGYCRCRPDSVRIDVAAFERLHSGIAAAKQALRENVWVLRCTCGQKACSVDGPEPEDSRPQFECCRCGHWCHTECAYPGMETAEITELEAADALVCGFCSEEMERNAKLGLDVDGNEEGGTRRGRSRRVKKVAAVRKLPEAKRAWAFSCSCGMKSSSAIVEPGARPPGDAFECERCGTWAHLEHDHPQSRRWPSRSVLARVRKLLCATCEGTELEIAVPVEKPTAAELEAARSMVSGLGDTDSGDVAVGSRPVRGRRARASRRSRSSGGASGDDSLPPAKRSAAAAFTPLRLPVQRRRPLRYVPTDGAIIDVWMGTLAAGAVKWVSAAPDGRRYAPTSDSVWSSAPFDPYAPPGCDGTETELSALSRKAASERVSNASLASSGWTPGMSSLGLPLQIPPRQTAMLPAGVPQAVPGGWSPRRLHDEGMQRTAQGWRGSRGSSARVARSGPPAAMDSHRTGAVLAPPAPMAPRYAAVTQPQVRAPAGTEVDPWGGDGRGATLIAPAAGQGSHGSGPVELPQEESGDTDRAASSGVTAQSLPSDATNGSRASSTPAAPAAAAEATSALLALAMASGQAGGSAEGSG